ncbi:MAG: DNA-binding transcriptional regulator [Pirellulales bacterium]|nr:DNA-binding transcriptional regulator [Pirellulales bacterium]
MLEGRRVAILPDFSEPYDREVMRGISRYVHEHGQWSLYVPSDPDHRIAQLELWRGDGIIANTDDRRIAKAVQQLDVAVVGFGGGTGIQGPRIRYLATDNREIARLGAEHLLDRGFVRFGFCAMPRSARNQPWSEERARAFQERIERAGYGCSIFRDTEKVSRNWPELLRQLSAWIDSFEKPVGVMAAYDLRALHLLEACRHLELLVPDDVAVIGVDNDEQICDLAIPPLTSIIQGGARLGYAAAALLERMMSGDVPADRGVFAVPPVGIVTRQSTDVLAIDDCQITAALRYIREHACDGIDVHDVVKQTTISRTSLEQRFKRALGRTLHDEIQRVQINHVKLLLQATDLPIREIATRAGFKYPEYLSNLFHRLTGQTLGEYRTYPRRCGDGPRIQEM